MSTTFLTRDTFSYAPHRGVAQSVSLATIGALVCFSLTLPVITISDNLPWLKVEQALLPFLALLYAWMLLTGTAKPIRWNGMFLIGAVFSLSIGISIWYGAEILRHPVLIRDYYEIPKAWLPVVFYTIGLESDLDEKSLRLLWRWFGVTIALICLYAWAQFLRLGFTYPLNALYSGGEHIDQGLLVHGRVYSTMGNANVLGQLMTWAIAGFTMAFLFRVGNRAIHLAMAAACVVTLAMTGSRYGLITTVVALMLAILIPGPQKRRRAARVVLLLVVVPVFVYAFAATIRTNQGNAQRIATLRHPLEADSLRARLDSLWLDAADDIVRSPVLGFGPAKVFYTGVFTDSEYLDVLKEFGAVGLLAYLAYYVFPLTLLWRGLRRTQPPGFSYVVQTPARVLTSRFAFVAGTTALLMNVGESTFYNQLLQAFLWLWLGLGVNSLRSVRKAQIVFSRPDSGNPD